ncbi:MAG: hypothetical protein ACM34I_13345 [bacterium]
MEVGKVVTEMKYTDDLEEMLMTAAIAIEAIPEVPHAEPGAFEAIKSSILGHGEQTVLPDDCQFGDNDLCSVES